MILISNLTNTVCGYRLLCISTLFYRTVDFYVDGNLSGNIQLNNKLLETMP